MPGECGVYVQQTIDENAAVGAAAAGDALEFPCDSCEMYQLNSPALQ